MTYIATTKVSVERTKAEIEALAMKRGADHFACFSSRDDAQIAFQLNGRKIQLKLPLPARDDPKFPYPNEARGPRMPLITFALRASRTGKVLQGSLKVGKENHGAHHQRAHADSGFFQIG